MLTNFFNSFTSGLQYLTGFYTSQFSNPLFLVAIALFIFAIARSIKNQMNGKTKFDDGFSYMMVSIAVFLVSVVPF